MLSSGLKVRRADNDIRLGIAAVAARLRTGRLKVDGPACPQLLHEARLYRYPTASERFSVNENPVDEHNHALGALRYLIAALDARFIAKLRKRPDAKTPDEPARAIDPIDNPELWTEMK